MNWAVYSEEITASKGAELLGIEISAIREFCLQYDWKNTIQAMREFRQDKTLADKSIKKMIEEGRK